MSCPLNIRILTLCLFTVNYSQHWLELGLDWILILSHLLFCLYCLNTIWLRWFYVVLYFCHTFKRTYAHIKCTAGLTHLAQGHLDMWTRLKPQLRLDTQFGRTTKWIMKSHLFPILRMSAEKYSFSFCYEDANTKMQNAWLFAKISDKVSFVSRHATESSISIIFDHAATKWILNWFWAPSG